MDITFDDTLFEVWYNEGKKQHRLPTSSRNTFGMTLDKVPFFFGLTFDPIEVRGLDRWFIAVGRDENGALVGFYNAAVRKEKPCTLFSLEDASDSSGHSDSDSSYSDSSESECDGDESGDSDSSYSDSSESECDGDESGDSESSDSDDDEKWGVTLCALTSSGTGYNIIFLPISEAITQEGTSVYYTTTIERPAGDVMRMKFRVGDTYTPIDVASSCYEHLYSFI